MATVYQTLVIFLQRYTQAVVAFAGSTPARTRLFRIAITQRLDQLAQHFAVWGILDDGFEAFQPNQPYTGFMISPKNITIV